MFLPFIWPLRHPKHQAVRMSHLEIYKLRLKFNSFQFVHIPEHARPRAKIPEHIKMTDFKQANSL